jgi:hypothetical protein
MLDGITASFINAFFVRPLASQQLFSCRPVAPAAMVLLSMVVCLHPLYATTGKG